MPGDGGEAVCTACAARFEYMDGADVEWEAPHRHWHYELMVCTKCKALKSVPFFHDETTNTSAPDPAPAKCSTSSCRRVLRPWPGTITADGIEGPCPKCGAPLTAGTMRVLWD